MLCLSIQYLSIYHAKETFKQSIMNISTQADIESFADIRSLKWLTKKAFQIEKYLTKYMRW